MPVSTRATTNPERVTASARDQWRQVRLRDTLPFLKYLHSGWSDTASGRGAVAEFEREFAKLTATNFALAMNSGTAALHSALFAVGVGPGDEVILPSYTWHATASAVLCCGARPVFCDINPRTLTADPADLRKRITKSTKAVIVVHVWGNPAELDTIQGIAKEYGVKLIEDCSHAHGAVYQGKPVGAWGDVGCFSLQASKAVSAGEGGVAVCSNSEYFDRMLMLGHPLRVKGQMNLGPKYRPHFLGILLALMTLRRLSELNRWRRRNWQILCEELSSSEEVSPIETLPGAERGGFLEYKFILNMQKLGGDREHFIRLAVAEGIPLSTDRYGFLHEASIFLSGKPLPLPNTEAIRNRIISLPGFVKVSENYLRQCARGLTKIARRLSEKNHG